MAKKTFYDVLQVSPSADTEIIKAAYNSLIQRFYPDGSPGDPNDDFLKALNKAYEVLSDPAKRAGYDAALSATGDVDMGQAGTSGLTIGIGKQASTKNRNEDSDYPDYEYAGFWERFAALFLDGLVLMVFSIPAWIVIWIGETHGGNVIVALACLMFLAISPIYFSVMESGEKSATYGKRWMGLKVLDLNNQRISGGRALARWASHGFSNITLYVGYFIQPFTQRKQALHDLVSGTIVVRTEREKKSSRIVIAVAAAFFMVPVIGILAAIAIPAYDDYQKRATAQQSQQPATFDPDAFLANTGGASPQTQQLATPADPLAQREILKKLADGGNADAQYTLAQNFNGLSGAPVDIDKVIYYLRKAAEQGHSGAQYFLGIMYSAGRGVPKDANTSALWNRKAAEQGNADAQNTEGWKYYEGKDVPQDYALAASWFHKAAEQGDFASQRMLGKMYSDGQGLPKNYSTAALWLRKAAEQGDADAQALLGMLYSSGEGVPKDFVQAYMWINLAASSRDPNQGKDKKQLVIEYRKAIEANMSPLQIEQAQALTRDWLAKHKPWWGNFSFPER